MKKLFLFLCVLLFPNLIINGQHAEVEVIVIDSYVTPEKPHKLVLSFFTSENVTSSVTLDDRYNFVVSDSLAEDHKIEIDVTDLLFDSTYVKCFIAGKTADGKNYKSEEFEVVLPFKNKFTTDRNTSLITVCCFGGVIFGLPSPTVVFDNDETLFSIVKEIPLFSFYSGGYNYPVGYISIEYAHIFNADFRNYLRLGYKQVFTLEPIEFISAGVSGFTTFEGFNGLSPELTLGWFKIYNAFTVYTRYRFNFQPSYSKRNFHEISIGLYSNFFSLNL